MRGAGTLLAAVAVTLLITVAATYGSSAKVVVALTIVLFAIAAFGPETCICIALLMACGLVPYIQPTQIAAGGLPYWLIGFAFAAFLMLAAAGARWLADEPVARVQPSVLLWLAGTLLVYTLIVLGQSSPTDVKSAAAPFVAFPLGAFVTFVWLLHERAVENMTRLLPFVVVIVAAWTIAYVLGASGTCGTCQRWVGTLSAGNGLLGASSRLYTWGQQAFLGFALLAIARALWQPSRRWVALALLGAVCVFLQYSRAQEIAVFGGFVVLLIWRLYRVPAATKLLAVILTGLAVYAVASSTIGHHIASGYEGLGNGTGTGAYRLSLLADIRRSWSLFGVGISYQTLDLGYNQDLGVPNSLLIIGYVGTALQLALLVVGVLRGLLTRSAIGIALASVLVMVLLARPSLPFLETGTGAVAYGVTLGALAALYVRGGTRGALQKGRIAGRFA